jgi:hypothetical protein
MRIQPFEDKLIPKKATDDFDFHVIQAHSSESSCSYTESLRSEDEDSLETHMSPPSRNFIPFVDRYAALKSRWIAYHKSSFTA